MANLRSVRILIVDDNPVAAYLTCDILQQAKLNVVKISISQSALAAMGLLGNNEFDCVICNGQLPTMTGLEFARHIKLAGIEANVILLADSDVTDLDTGTRDAGVVGVLGKATLTSDKIGSAIEDVLGDIVPITVPHMAARTTMAW